MRSPATSVIGLTILLAAAGCGSGEPGEVDTSADEGTQPVRVERPAGVARSAVQFRGASGDSVAGSEVLPGPDGASLALAPQAVLTESDITAVEVGPGVIEPRWVVYLHVTPQAADRLRQVSLENVGRTMAIVIDGEVVLDPEIRAELPSPFVIDGEYSREEAMRMAERMAP